MSRRRNRRRAHESAPPAALLQLFSESVFGMPPWMLAARMSDFNRGGSGVALGMATGTPSDRKAGRDVPLFWSEVDLRGYRVLARHITDSNPFGIGFLGTLVDYHVRKGYGWQACKRGAKKAPYQTTGAPADPLVAKAQRILDEFRNATLWPLKSREAFRRWVRDGEVLGRWFYGGTGRLPDFRFGEPDALGSPTGNNDDDESFGIATPPGDPAGPAEAYHFFEPDGVRGQWVDADRVTYAKRGTDSGVKRGITDFHPVARELEDCTKLVRTMLATAIRQAGTAWIEKYPAAAMSQVSAAVPEFAAATGYGGQARAPVDGGVPWFMMPQVGGGLNPWEPPGVVRKVEGSREYVPGPTSTGTPGYIAVEQAALRGCGVIWRCPEYFTGDASNSNMASLIVAGSPFTICVESNQFEWGAAWERACALKVFELAARAGLLTREEVAQLDVEVTEPAVVVADPGKDYETVSKQIADKVICLDTARQKSGYDPQHEAEGVKKDLAVTQPAGGPGDPPPDDGSGAGLDDDPFDGGPDSTRESLDDAQVTDGVAAAAMEWLGVPVAEHVEEGRREGEVWQTNGHWFTLKNGRTVRAKAPAGQQRDPSRHDGTSYGNADDRDSDDKHFARKAKLAQRAASDVDDVRSALAGALGAQKAHTQHTNQLRHRLDQADAKVAALQAKAKNAALLVTANHWADAAAAKHAARVAAHFGISEAQARVVLGRAIRTLAARALEGGSASGTLRGPDGRELKIGVGRRESIFAEDKLVTVHMSNGTTYQRHQRGGASEPDEHGDHHAAELHADDRAAIAHGIAADVDALPEGQRPPAGLVAKATDLALTAAARAYLWAKSIANNPKTAALGSLMGDILDTPSDLGKLGYNPNMSSGTANPKTADFVSANLNDALGFGVSGHLVASIASKVIVKAGYWAAAKVGGKSAEGTESDGYREWAEMIAQLLAHLNEQMGVTGGAPGADTVEKGLRALVAARK